eukprot:jgi/Botrbrau1/23493/Bobra.106_1s0044.1
MHYPNTRSRLAPFGVIFSIRVDQVDVRVTSLDVVSAQKYKLYFTVSDEEADTARWVRGAKYFILRLAASSNFECCRLASQQSSPAKANLLGAEDLIYVLRGSIVVAHN